MVRWTKKRVVISSTKLIMRGSVAATDRAIVDLLLRGKNYEEIAKALASTTKQIKHRVKLIAKDYGITTPIYAVKLAVAITYARNPELVPFNDGDRAEQLGHISASDYYALRERSGSKQQWRMQTHADLSKNLYV